MAIQFTKTKEKEAQFTNMLNKLDNASKEIKPYATDEVLGDLARIKANFKRRIDDFYRDERKLNLAVIGRVKAGKSTFLNALLFDGNDVLPSAFTPKTATLTKIEYAEQSAIEVEYYSAEEWQMLMDLAHSKVISEEANVAKELADAVGKSGIDTSVYTSKGKERVELTSEEVLIGTLNRYVGEDGNLTPLVKSVSLYLDRQELQGISIVDTPGLNDPVQSRTQRTREFLEVCDTIFFLSPASQFLNKGDITLLKSQLPQKGIARMQLLCSRFDNGLEDVVFNYDSVSEAIKDTKHRLRKHAQKSFSDIQSDNVTAIEKELYNACRQPVFLSSTFHNMAKHPRNEDNEHEKHAFEAINEREDVNDAVIAELGDISAIEQFLNEVISDKDIILAEKADKLLPGAEKEFKDFISNEKQVNLNHINKLVSKDKEELEKQRKEIQSQIHNIQAKLEEYFGELLVKIEKVKIAIRQDLRRGSREYGTLADKVGTETVREAYTVSDSKWYNPFSWGSSHTEYSTYTVQYNYVDTSDALENIRHFANDSAGMIDEGFSEAIELNQFKRNLLKVVVDNFDASSAEYDPGHFLTITQRTINRFKIPIISISVDKALADINSSFSGKIRDDEKRNALKNQLACAISGLFDSISEQLEEKTDSFKADITGIKETFGEELLKSINDDFNQVIKACEDKENSIKKLQEYDEVLQKLG